VRSGLTIHAADALSNFAVCGKRVQPKEKKVDPWVPVTCKACRVELQLPRLSFCEPVSAAGGSAIHIRILSPQGRYLGGGADTPALCGRAMAWDNEGPVTDETVGIRRTCPQCRLIFREARLMQERLAAVVP
jgi:hypothetical protein